MGPNRFELYQGGDHHQKLQQIDPDGKMQWNLERVSVQGLLRLYENEDDEDLKILYGSQLNERYAPCVYGKDETIGMHPDYNNPLVLETINEKDYVTYEDPESPEPEKYNYVDAISMSFYPMEKKKEAYEKAEQGARSKTARWWELFLSDLYGKQIQVNRMIASISSDGCYWDAIGYSIVPNSIKK